MKIRIERPEDPELQRQYDEARRTLERRKIQLIIDDETRPIWECAQRAAAEVAAWPAWKHTEQPRQIIKEAAARFDARPLHRASIEARAELADRDCCVGDVTRCRCHGRAPVAMSDEEEKWAAVWNDGGDE